MQSPEDAAESEKRVPRSMNKKRSSAGFASYAPAPGRRQRKALAVMLTVLACTAPWGAAVGQTFEEALINAYLTNPGLQAARAELRATDETVNQALSNWRPNVEVNADGGLARVDSLSSSNSESSLSRSRGLRRPRSVGLGVSQNIYRGGRTAAETEQREYEVLAQRGILADVEQDVLLDAATAFMDVFRDQAVVRLTRNNERVLDRQLEATRDRFSVGEVTRTDVSQAEARLARAKSDRIQAEGDLENSRTRFERVVGMPAGELKRPDKEFELPATMEEAIATSSKENPNVVAAQYLEQAAIKNVRKVQGELLPTVTLDGELEKSADDSGRGSERESAAIIANLRIPLYQRGAVSSRVRQAEQQAGQRRLEFDDQQRAAIEAARSAWERLSTARARSEAFRIEIRSNEIALEGVRQEANVGSRTVLDVLDAEQELLDAQVSLVRAERDEFVAAAELAAALGRFTAREYKLSVDYYDETEHYNKVRDKIYGFGK